MPLQRDLEIWDKIRPNFLDWGYTGPLRYFQIAGHRLLGRWARPFTDKTVLEIGCGHGHHLQYSGNAYSRYTGFDIEYPLLSTIRERFMKAIPVNGDAYALPFEKGSVDCVISVYNLEHLRQLPRSLSEIRRVLKHNGELLVGLPAEGGLLYEIGRQLTSKRYMERKYGIDYEAIVHWEHWNTYAEVVRMLMDQFAIKRLRFIPFWFVPSVHFNAIICLQAMPLEI
jgi:SAM-dependent methyltransferase